MKVTLFVRESRAKSSKGSAQLPLIICFRNGKMNLWQTTRLSVNPDWWDQDHQQHKAVREAFTNSIIHSDVFLSGGILRIEKHDDRLVLRNPGTLKLPLSKIIEGGSSKARNPRMQNMLRMIGYGENIGSGFPQILNAWKLAGWKEPVLEDRWDVQ